MKKRKKKNRQNRIAMLAITFVVGVLFFGMMSQSYALSRQLSDYKEQEKSLDTQIEEENERTAEIDDLKEYMQTDEYVEEIARDKLGLVKDNEIVFREGQSADQEGQSGQDNTESSEDAASQEEEG